MVKLSVWCFETASIFTVFLDENLLHGWMEFSYHFLPRFECWGIWSVKYCDLLPIIHWFIAPKHTPPKHSVHDRALFETCHSSNLFSYLYLFQEMILCQLFCLQFTYTKYAVVYLTSARATKVDYFAHCECSTILFYFTTFSDMWTMSHWTHFSRAHIRR
jgi:hypothetical protein